MGAEPHVYTRSVKGDPTHCARLYMADNQIMDSSYSLIGPVLSRKAFLGHTANNFKQYNRHDGFAYESLQKPIHRRFLSQSFTS
jgi:hypothetical protein